MYVEPYTQCWSNAYDYVIFIPPKKGLNHKGIRNNQYHFGAMFAKLGRWIKDTGEKFSSMKKWPTDPTENNL